MTDGQFLDTRLTAGTSYPLGASFDGRGVNFAVYSGMAEAMELCLFQGPRREHRLSMPACTDGIWHGYLAGARPGLAYGYRAYGPYDPRLGQRFNPHKLLIDPYARLLDGQIRWHDALHGYRIGAQKADLSFDKRDSSNHVPKALVVDDRFDWESDHPPRIPWSDTIIYEMHVRGWSRLREDLPEHDRGTFGALGHANSIEYLKRLGITAVELLPIHAYARDRHLLERGLTNYWGYNTLAYFAPEMAYLSDGTLGQIKWAVRQLHRAGIEVILDVVYNHTCEGNELGPTLSWRGFGNAEYYRLMPDEPRYHINDTGCGNTLQFSHPRVIQMAMDSLRYWVQEFHVDGFRFDLGVTLGREDHGFDPGSGFFDALMQDPVLARVKLISEPWDIGLGGYQIGNHPAGMGEWNGRYRDDLRRYWKGDTGLRGTMASRLQGSAELFDHHRRRPWASVNFITAHDGFTLRDLVSYDGKHNEANGEDNRDGSEQNDSHNWGWEGDTEDEAILARRRRVQRALLTCLLTSLGTPMLLAGDEFGQTQQGNNNVYCQDNETSWLDWMLPESEAGSELLAYVQRLIALRLNCMALRVPFFQYGLQELLPGITDIAWCDETGRALSQEDWENPVARRLAVRRAASTDDGEVDVALLLINGDTASCAFQLPEPELPYQLDLDSTNPAQVPAAIAERHCEVGGHGIVVLTARIAMPAPTGSASS